MKLREAALRAQAYFERLPPDLIKHRDSEGGFSIAAHLGHLLAADYDEIAARDIWARAIGGNAAEGILALRLCGAPNNPFGSSTRWSKWRVPPQEVFARVAKMESLPSLRGPDSFGCNLEKADLSGARLGGVDLSGVILTSANCQDADFRDACLAEADLDHAVLTGANFEGADLSYATLNEATATGANFRGANLMEVTADEADFSDADMRDADMRSSRMPGSSFFAARLNGAQMQNGYFQRSEFWKAELDGANLQGADTRDTEGEIANWGIDERLERLGHAIIP